MQWIDYIVLGLYAVALIGIAIYTRNKSKTVNDFLLAGKKGLNGWMSAFSYGTTYFSAVIFIGYAGKFGWDFGLGAVWIGVGNALFGGLLAWIIMAKRTKNMTLRLSAKTMPEFFEKRYESRFLKIASAIIIFVFLIPYSASVYNGLSNLFEIIFGIDGIYIIIALAVITAIYLVFGGYLATSLSDFIQGIIMIVGVIVMIVFFCVNLGTEKVFNGQAVTIGTLPDLFAQGFGLVPSYGDNGFLSSPLISLISLILLTSFGVYGLPQTVHKYYSVRDKKAVNQGMIVSTIFAMLIGIIAYFVGGLGRLFFTQEQVTVMGGTDSIVPNMLSMVIPVGLLGLIGVLVLSASMSTLASVSLSSASVVAIDLYKGAIKKDASDKKVTLLMRILCFIFVLISVGIAILNHYFNITAIAYLMSLSWGTLAGCFFGPFVIGLYSKKLTKAGAITSVIGGLVLTIVLTVVFGVVKAGANASFGAILQQGVASSPLTGVICMVFSIIVTTVVSLFTKKPSSKTIEDAFNKQVDNLIF